MEYQDIPCKNDRTRLVLYKYWNGCISKEYDKLQKIYSDNHIYEDIIINVLFSSNYIMIEGGDRYGKEEGKIYTTELGVEALSCGRFPSETKAETRNRAIKYMTLICSAIASLAGVKIIYELLVELLK